MTTRRQIDWDTYEPRPSWINCQTFANRGGVDPRAMSHGGPSGSAIHRRRGEKPCDLCREASNAYRRMYRKAGREPKRQAKVAS